MSCQQVPTTPALNPYPRSVQVGEFEVAIDGGIWVAIRVGVYFYGAKDWPYKSLFYCREIETLQFLVNRRIAGLIPRQNFQLGDDVLWLENVVCVREITLLGRQGIFHYYPSELAHKASKLFLYIYGTCLA